MAINRKSLFDEDVPFPCTNCKTRCEYMIYGEMEVCSWECFTVEFDKMRNDPEVLRKAKAKKKKKEPIEDNEDQDRYRG
jgi:hypothetical protein